VIFSVDGHLFDLFPGLRIGVLVCRVDNTRYGEDILDPVLEKVRTGFLYDSPQDHPHIKLWRDAFARLAIPPMYPTSIETLLTRALAQDAFPRVNPLVDLCNAVSLDFLVPVGTQDLSVVDGNMHLGFAQGTERFTPIEGGEDQIVEKNEVIYKDERAALTRRWLWRQSNKSRVMAETRYAFMPVDVMGTLVSSLPDAIMDRITGHLQDNGGGTVIFRDVVTRQKPSVQFAI
jgi:DNA/RNA-binding domain of Phe-tRNA-synthetase-like protein